jgi:hypothetical protein
MRGKPEDEQRSAVQSSGRHRTVMAAAVRRPTGPQRAAPPRRPGPRWLPEAEPDQPSRAADTDDWDAAEQDGAWNGYEDEQGWDDAEGRAGGTADGPHTTVIFDRGRALVPSLSIGVRAVASRARSPQATVRRIARAVGQLATGRDGDTPRPTLIPGKPTAPIAAIGHTRVASRGSRWRSRPLASLASLAACVMVVATLIAAEAANRGEPPGRWASGLWTAEGGVHAAPTPIGGFWMPPIQSSAPLPPSFLDARHYVTKYGFDYPAQSSDLWPGERERLVVMMPFAIAATARWDARFGDALEPQMLLFWTHAEGIAGRVTYSNCANEGPPAGASYFTWITNCDTPSFWQLGYGNQFGVIDILKTAFTDMRGDPNDPQVVQHVGQAVLDWDRQHGATPACGGYPCTFPAMTIDQIMAGVSLTHKTTNDWWASVLSRDPAINCYMLARALVWFNHNETRNWVGCYYAEPCWSYESNRLGDILAAWPSLAAAAGA